MKLLGFKKIFYQCLFQNIEKRINLICDKQHKHKWHNSWEWSIRIWQDIEFSFYSVALHLKCDLRFSALPGNCWQRNKNIFLPMLLTHPLTYMGRVSLLAAHFCALLCSYSSPYNILSSMFTRCLTWKWTFTYGRNGIELKVLIVLD